MVWGTERRVEGRWEEEEGRSGGGEWGGRGEGGPGKGRGCGAESSRGALTFHTCCHPVRQGHCPRFVDEETKVRNTKYLALPHATSERGGGIWGGGAEGPSLVGS